MCGIAVAIDWPGAESVVRALMSDMAHRGDVSDPIVSPRDARLRPFTDYRSPFVYAPAGAPA